MGGYVVDMAVDGTGKLWAVSEKNGLLYMGRDGKLHKCKSAELPESIVSICSDGDWLWLGSWAGIFRFDVKTGNVKSYGRGLNTGWKDNKVHKLFKTSSGEILAGTTLGMIKYDKSSDHFRPLPIFSGIYVTDMAEALDGTLWVASYADGICRYGCSAIMITRKATTGICLPIRSCLCTLTATVNSGPVPMAAD